MKKIRNNLFLILLVSICTLFFTVSKPNNEARAEDYATLQISSFSFVGNEGNNPAIGLYRITLASNMDANAGLTFATPNTVIQKQDGTTAADIRGENTNNSLIVRIPYGRVQTGATSITDLTDNTEITIKSGVTFALDNGAFQFDKDMTLIYRAGSGCFVEKVQATQIKIQDCTFLGYDGGNAAIGLYRISLESPLKSAVGVVFATPNTVVQKADGNSAADIRGEGADSSLIVRVPYGRVQGGA